MASILYTDATPFFLESHFLADVCAITVSPKNNNWGIVMKDDYRIYNVPCNRNIFFAALPCLCQNASLHASLCIFLSPKTDLGHILHASFECFPQTEDFFTLNETELPVRMSMQAFRRLDYSNLGSSGHDFGILPKDLENIIGEYIKFSIRDGIELMCNHFKIPLE